MAAVLIAIRGLVKAYAALRPLRIAEVSVAAGDRLVLRGFDQGAAEMFVHLVTGAAVPDEGHVQIDGRDTREIATDTEWLHSLDRFGIVTHRAVLLEGMSLAANLALPLTLAIEPMAPETRERAARDAADVRLDAALLDRPVSGLDEEGRLRLHLARAVASGPQLVMLEHPTAKLTDEAASQRIGETLRALSESRGFGWIALSEDQAFATASGGRVLDFDAARGTLAESKRGWRRWF